jgi:predicted RNA-binding Zn-ribbon protein involved in translation (DUF1610 family)
MTKANSIHLQTPMGKTAMNCPNCGKLGKRVVERVWSSGTGTHGHLIPIVMKLASAAAKLLMHQFYRCPECGHIWGSKHWPA